MDTLTSEYLRKLQTLQSKYGEQFNTFDVMVLWDEYYETILRCSYTDDNGRYMADFTRCVDAEDFNRVYRQLEADIMTNVLERNDDE